MRRGRGFLGLGLLMAIVGHANAPWAYEIGGVANGGTISGKVTFNGVAPPPKQFAVKKDPEVCGIERKIHEVGTNNGRLQGVVVVLEGVISGKPFLTATSKGDAPGEGEFRYGGGDHLSLEIFTKGCNFGPFTGVLTADEPVRFVNEDPVKHILHSVSSKDEKGLILRTIHNRELRPQTIVERTFYTSTLKTQRIVGIHCNRHDFMQNWFYVVTSPYFSISDQEGAFTIAEVPPGEYELIAWHPVLGLQRQSVQVTAKGSVEVNFTFSMK